MALNSLETYPRLIKVVLLLLICTVLVIELQYVFDNKLGLGSFEKGRALGTGDFLAYWQAYRVYRLGENPYALGSLEKIDPGEKIEGPKEVFNPPWLFAILSPVLMLQFHAAAKLWLVLNVGFLFGIGLCAWRLVSKSKPNWLLFSTGLILFWPVWEVLDFGQLSLIVGFGTIASCLALVKGRDTLAGSLLVLATIKPHLVYLVGFIILLSAIHHRRWAFFYGAFACLFGVVSLAFMQSPRVFVHWLQAEVSPYGLKSSTLATALRMLFHQPGAGMPFWPLVLVPLVGLAGASLWYVRREGVFEWSEVLPPLMCLSMFTAPYGWVFDQAILVSVQVMILAEWGRKGISWQNRTAVLLWLVLLQSAAVIIRFGASWHHEFFWFPFALFFVWWRSSRLLAADKQLAWN